MTLVLTPGQRNECTVFAQLLAQGAVQRPGRGRPRRLPARVAGDQGYSSAENRGLCRRRGIRHTIPRRRCEHRTGPFDRALYRLRVRVEHTINRCKRFRSLATRSDKTAAHYRALWLIAFTILWIGRDL